MAWQARLSHFSYFYYEFDWIPDNFDEDEISGMTAVGLVFPQVSGLTLCHPVNPVLKNIAFIVNAHPPSI